MGVVVRPRALTYSGTCHQWFWVGASAIRVLPTICIHMCRVSRVSCHSANGRLGQVSGSSIRRSLLSITITSPPDIVSCSLTLPHGEEGTRRDDSLKHPAD